MKFETFLYEKVDHVAIVTFNRPERMNSLCAQMEREAIDLWREVNHDDDVWVVILTGAGDRAFCAGQDVFEAVDDIDSGSLEARFTPGRILARTEEPRIMPKMFNVYKPIVCAVNGVAAGGGLHAVAESEIVIASEHATFTDSHVTSGHVSSLDSVLLARRIGYTNAMRMVCLGSHERMTAQRAYEVGLVTEVVPHEQLMDRAMEIAQTVCKNAPIAVRKSVEGSWRGQDYGLSQAFELGTYLFHENWLTEDFKEGNRAFAEKRPPVWKNR